MDAHMTATAHWLIRLHGNEDWEAWGQDWRDHVDKVAELHWIDDFMPSPNWLREHRSHQLDWHAFLYVMRKYEIPSLLRRPPSDQQQSEWQRQLELLEALDAHYRYAVVWIEPAEDSQPSIDSIDDDRRIYIRPDWPEGSFNLRALNGGWEIGPFTKDSWQDDGPDGRIAASERGPGAKPTGLRVRRQTGNIVHANNGDMGPMDYRIVALSEYEDDE